MTQFMTNTDRDIGRHVCSGYQHGHALLDASALHEALRRSMRGSAWKSQVQRYEMTWLLNIARVRRDLEAGQYRPLPASFFTLRERGKVRHIRGEHVQDRMIKHCLCDNVLNPAVLPKLIYDNGASIKGRGLSFTRKRLVAHLGRFYREHGNDGWVLLVDFTHYYDSIRHDLLLDMFREAVGGDALSMSVVEASVAASEKTPGRGLYLGDQTAQTAGVLYLSRLDNFTKCVRGERFYGRYMDDCYVIHHDREHLKALLAGIREQAAAFGLAVNERKTHIVRLSSAWRFCQLQYRLTATGRVVRKINPRRVSAMRRKMKKLAGRLGPRDFGDWFRSWLNGQRRHMSCAQRGSINSLYLSLTGGTA